MDVVVWYEPFENGTWDWGISTVNEVTGSMDHYPIVIDWPNVLPDDLIEGKDWTFSDGAYGNCFPGEYIFKIGVL